MHDTTFLDRNEPITMDGLRTRFRKHDFSTQTSGYKFKNASSEKNQMYLKVKGIFRAFWNQQMKKLCKKGSLKNFSADAPIRCLEESEEKLVAGTVMEILGKEALAEQLMDQILTSMQEPINTEVPLDFSPISHYNLIRIRNCHRVVSESACLHIVRS